MSIMRPLLPARREDQYILIKVDCLTNLVKVESMTTQDAKPITLAFICL